MGGSQEGSGGSSARRAQGSWRRGEESRAPETTLGPLHVGRQGRNQGRNAAVSDLTSATAQLFFFFLFNNLKKKGKVELSCSTNFPKKGSSPSFHCTVEAKL